MTTNNINWAVVIGVGMLAVAIVGGVVNVLPAGSEVSLIGIALGVLGIHSTVNSLGRKG